MRGPRGLVRGAIVVRELHQDGKFEAKTFAPGYGEFRTGGGGNLEALALAVPTDALPGPVPPQLETLSSGAADVFDAAGSERWKASSAGVAGMSDAWDTYRRRGVPPFLAAQMTDALEALTGAVEARDPNAARQAAIDVARATLDLQLRYRAPAEIDLARFDLVARQLFVDAASGDRHAVAGDVATLDWIWDRVAHTIDRSASSRIDVQLGELRAAPLSDDPADATSAAARRLRNTLSRLLPKS